jgi:hypothetical protein
MAEPSILQLLASLATTGWRVDCIMPCVSSRSQNGPRLRTVLETASPDVITQLLACFIDTWRAARYSEKDRQAIESIVGTTFERRSVPIGSPITLWAEHNDSKVSFKAVCVVASQDTPSSPTGKPVILFELDGPPSMMEAIVLFLTQDLCEVAGNDGSAGYFEPVQPVDGSE